MLVRCLIGLTSAQAHSGAVSAGSLGRVPDSTLEWKVKETIQGSLIADIAANLDIMSHSDCVFRSEAGARAKSWGVCPLSPMKQNAEG